LISSTEFLSNGIIKPPQKPGRLWFKREENNVKNIDWKAVLAVLAVVVAVILVWRLIPAGPGLDLTDEILSLSQGKDQLASIPFGEIRSMSLTDEFDTGETAGGERKGHYLTGGWKNDDLGDYTLCINDQIGMYIIVETDSSAVVFNYESAATTRGIFDMLQGALTDNGYEVSFEQSVSPS